ncbi:glycosyltransferase family 9 protein [Dyadobacter sp. CY261]|uniref:glycosyltransferase family 9 protein n=1 Tax=Dyadobacter sp. CY261 TaxID=2907203 RepID=UPI001F4006C4|nr:glycosyltransferase family 9 protein [Dyadobacter sp. CY261]MCF0069627.1 glycosyltransferase family 9 protein [Dyadobacter sp. CY261]
MSEHLPFRNVLCIRADNMGDVIMSSPAMRALKESFGSRITLLTSKAGAMIVPYLDCVDGLVTADLPWVKHTGGMGYDLPALARQIASMHFDAVVIFTVYSQSALPAAMLAYMAGIPVRIAYARENPYELLTTWLPDDEPYERIRHQVERDLNLVGAVGAEVADCRLSLTQHTDALAGLRVKLAAMSIDTITPYVVLHPGVSEEKRQYPVHLWIETGRLLAAKYGLPLLISGSGSEKAQADAIAQGIGNGAWSVAGALSLGELIALIGGADYVVSVNTATMHIAAAMQTPVVGLYAQTNPQHTPWKSPHELLYFSVPSHLQSRNTIIRDVARRFYAKTIAYPSPADVATAVERLLMTVNF